MLYEVVKAFNNNVVLVKNDNAQYVLISKGVGFSKKPKDIINDELITDEIKLFYTLDNYNTPSEINRLGRDLTKLENITHQIVDLAQNHLGVCNDKLFDALYDHIVFATERLRVGIPISNPFITEIMVLCPNEFEISKIAAKLLKEQINVDIGVDEQGFIALHLYSANEKNSAQNMPIYSKISSMLEQKHNILDNPIFYKHFVQSLDHLISSYKNNNKAELPFEVITAIKNNMGRFCDISNDICEILQDEMEISEEFKVILAFEIFKLLKI